MKQFRTWLVCVFSGIALLPGLAQISVKTTISDNTPITDKTTGKRVSFQEYRELIKPDPHAYHLDPVYDEYGQASSFKLRPTTAQERETHGFNYQDSTLRLRVGQEMPLFIMNGPDGRTYRSTDQKGQVVVLSFWISLNKPYWQEKRAEPYGNAIRPYQVVSLGIVNNSRREVIDHLAKEPLPFVPIPDSYGFSRKFQMLGSPGYIVIDKAGRVAGVIETDFDRTLKAVLEKVTQ